MACIYSRVCTIKREKENVYFMPEHKRHIQKYIICFRLLKYYNSFYQNVPPFSICGKNIRKVMKN